jgi:Arm DNA-binding domain
MPSKELTPAHLRNLKPPPGGVLELWDARARGLCLRVFASGRATWTFRYRPKNGGARRRIRLGDYPTVGLAEARRRADRHRGAVADGADPQSALLRAQGKAPTLASLIDRYLAEEVASKKKPRTLALYTSSSSGSVPSSPQRKRTRSRRATSTCFTASSAPRPPPPPTGSL